MMVLMVQLVVPNVSNNSSMVVVKCQTASSWMKWAARSVIPSIIGSIASYHHDGAFYKIRVVRKAL